MGQNQCKHKKKKHTEEHYNDFTGQLCEKIDTKDIHLLFNYRGHHLLYEYSVGEKVIIQKYPIHDDFNSILIAYNKKSFFVTGNMSKDLYQFDMHSKNCIKFVENADIANMIATYDNKYLIYFKSQCPGIHIRSARTQKLLNTFQLDVREKNCQLVCSQDNRFLFIRKTFGFLSVADIQKCCIIVNFEFTIYRIWSSNMFIDAYSVIICDGLGRIYKLSWEKNAKTKEDFQLIKNYGKLSISDNSKMVLLGGNENVLVGSQKMAMVSNLKTGEIIKKFEQNSYIRDIEWIESGKKAIIVQ